MAQGEGKGGDPLRVWVESSMVRVLPGDPAPPERVRPTARLTLAKGEYESFQVLLRPGAGRPLENVRLEVNDLICHTKGSRLRREQIEWHQVGFVRVHETEQKGPAPIPWLEPGWYPDPLLPVEQFRVEPEFTQSVWVTVHAPRGLPAGTYTGAITLHADGMKSLRIPLRATVHDFVIAPGAGHLRTAFALRDNFIRHLYKGDEAMVRAYRDYVLDRLRLNPWDIWHDAPPPVEELERLRARGMNAFPVCYLKDDTVSSEWPFAPSPKAVAEQLDTLAPAIQEIERRGLLPLGYIFGGDEVPREPPERIAQVKEAFALVKRRYPNIPLMTTAHIPQEVETLRAYHLDALCPMWDWTDFERAEGLRKAGIRIWTYISLQPYPPYPNWRLDNPLLEARTIFWQIYHQKFDAFLYWGLNIWDRPDNDQLIDPAAGPFLKWNITTERGGTALGWLHGDGRLLYPGKNGPIGSIRLANIRDGLEDYEYLWLLSHKMGDVEAGRQACLPVASGLKEFTRDPEVLRVQREAIARQLTAKPRR